MVGYLNLDITKIQNHVPILKNPDATPEQLDDAHQVIDASLQDMVQLLATACSMKQVTIDTTPLSDQDLQDKGLIDNSSNIDITVQAADAAATMASTLAA